MRVLGVDPGLLCTGYGIIEQKSDSSVNAFKTYNGSLLLLEAGVIRTSSRDQLTFRLNKIYTALLDIINTYQPQVLVMEELYSHYKNPRTAIIMAHARGVIYLAAAQARINVVGYAAKRVKKAITGTGTAKKMQIQRVIKEFLRLDKVPKPNDVADALAIALTYIQMSRSIL
ncbi:MAG: crossover junction endodeoxyribonuclease RuvC [Candidatus Omnitrophica bacterium]|nr:crossover junction endodeoxyribonuclease RuvC [Candidatus Omnitrophota bacterium]